MSDVNPEQPDPIGHEEEIDPLDHTRMPLGDHLEELRTRIIWGLIGPVVMMVICLYFGKDIISFLVMPLMEALEYNGLDTKIYAPGPTTAIITVIKVGLLGGLILGLPWLLYHIWKFIEAGLYSHEQKFVRILVPGSAILTVTGLAFLYYIMLPVCLGFLISFSISFGDVDVKRSYLKDKLIGTAIDIKDGSGLKENNAPQVIVPMLMGDPKEPKPGEFWFNLKENKYRLQIDEQTYAQMVPENKGPIAPEIRMDEYISFIMLMALAFTAGFQTPLVLFMLGKTGIVNHKQLGRMRKYAVVVCMVVGAFLTPQDPISMLFLAVPLYVLYEFGMLMMRFSGQKIEENGDDDDFSWDQIFDDPNDPHDDGGDYHDHDGHHHDYDHEAEHDPYHDHDHDGHWYDDGHDYEADYYDDNEHREQQGELGHYDEPEGEAGRNAMEDGGWAKDDGDLIEEEAEVAHEDKGWAKDDGDLIEDETGGGEEETLSGDDEDEFEIKTARDPDAVSREAFDDEDDAGEGSDDATSTEAGSSEAGDAGESSDGESVVDDESVVDGEDDKDDDERDKRE